MLRVHDLNFSRSIRITWLLEELGVPYEVVEYKRDPITFRAPPDLKKIHPLDKAPVIEDEGLIIAESGAIIEYLLNKYDKDGKLAPLTDDSEYAKYLEFLHFSEGTAFPALLPLVYEKNVGEDLPPGIKKVFQTELDAILGYISERIQNHRGFLLDRGFSAVDINFAFVLQAVGMAQSLESYPILSDYLKRVTDRPCYTTALSKQQ